VPVVKTIATQKEGIKRITGNYFTPVAESTYFR
jgi:hypothetical protein